MSINVCFLIWHNLAINDSNLFWQVLQNSTKTDNQNKQHFVCNNNQTDNQN